MSYKTICNYIFTTLFIFSSVIPTVFAATTNGKTIYVATTGGLSVSTDGGKTFTNNPVHPELGNYDIMGVYVDKDGIIYVASNQDFAISNDHGVSWVYKTLGAEGTNGVYVDETTTNKIIYVATQQGLSISKDGGKTFINKTQKDGLLVDPVAYVYVDQKGILYLAHDTVTTGGHSGISISKDQGAHFTTRTYKDGLPNGNINGIYALYNYVYVSGAGLSISKDNGETYINKTKADGLGGTTTVGVCADNAGTIYAAVNDHSVWPTPAGVAISKDGGKSFTYKLLFNDSCWANGINLDKDGVIYVSTQWHGIFISYDHGATYIQKTIKDGLGSDVSLQVFVR